MVTRRSARKLPSLTAIAYMRVSTSEQDLGLDVQRSAIEAWAAREGVVIAGWHEERIDGGVELKDRKALLAALADVKARRASRLVCYRLDRLGRDPLTSLLAAREVERAKASISFVVGGGEVTDDPTSRLLRGVLLSVAEFEKSLIGSRTRDALAVKRERGEALGRPGREAYGFRRTEDGRLEEHPGEQATLARARELYALEGVSVRAVVGRLASEGLMNRGGKPFGVAAMHAMLAG